MKRIYTLIALFALVACFGLTGCDQGTKPADNPDTNAAPAVVDTNAPAAK